NRIYATIFNTSWDWVDPETRRILIEELPSHPILTSPSPGEIVKPQLPDISFDEQLIYDHFIYCVEKESSEDLLKRFRQLFIEGNYPDPDVRDALERIIAFLRHEQQFQYLLYRCCTILINHWGVRPKQRAASAELVRLLQHSPKTQAVSPIAKRLEELRDIFLQSEEFLRLKRLREEILEWQNLDRILELRPIQPVTPLNQLLGRYPYLYSHRLISGTSSLEYRQKVRQRQSERQRQFEIELAQYATYLTRQSSKGTIPNLPGGNSLSNPTLLSDEQLYDALQQFVGKVDGSYTHQDLAQLFLSRIPRLQSYQAFKADLYEYLIATIDPRYGQTSFYQRLDWQLKNTFPEKDDRPPDKFLIVKTCSRLFKFLIESPEHPNFYLFLDLIFNLGETKTMGLLLKIILLSRPVRPHLEQRFSALFNYYDTLKTEEITWLVKALENLNIALVTNFGEIDLSFIKNDLT
ncbi:MAG: hypothetical protein SVX43_05450, partial [Cyanobacteriota bacterium]|nr:hypothetical protein [Cyanobacteriota bacterium]